MKLRLINFPPVGQWKKILYSGFFTMGFEFQILNFAFQGQIPDFIGIPDAKTWIADSTDGCIYLHVIIRISQERMAKIEEEEKQEHERKKREAEKKKQEIEVAEAMAKKRREEDVDDSKMVSWGFFFICLSSMGGHCFHHSRSPNR